MSEDSIYVESGADTGRIKNPNVAQEIANLEKPARDREIALRHGGVGLTEQQRLYVAVMEEAKVTYPHAFISTIDEQGREILKIRRPDSGEGRIYHNRVSTYITQEGFINVAGIRDSAVSFDDDGKLLELIDNRSQQTKEKQLPPVEPGFIYALDERNDFKILSLKDPGEIDSLRRYLEDAEKSGKDKQEKGIDSPLGAIRAGLFGQK